MQEKHPSWWARKSLLFGTLMVFLRSLLIFSAQSTEAAGLPLTNEVGITRVVLENVRLFSNPNFPAVELNLKTSSLSSHSVGWQIWAVAITDEAGRTIKSSNSRRVDGALSTNGLWDITLRGKEFIGGDHTDLPAEGEFRNCVMKPRALDYGLKHLLFLGKGYYRVQDGNVEESGLNPDNQSRFDFKEHGEIEIYTTDPSVFLVYDPAKVKIPLRARLRERPLKSAGRPFDAKTFSQLSYKSLGLDLHAQLHTFKDRKSGQLTTNKVEVEVVAALPEINFQTQAVAPMTR